MFITNNYNSFHLWWKENLVKHQNVSKYYDQDCWSFQNSLAIDTGLSDFHRITVAVIKIVNYRDFKKFSNVAFRDELLTNLCQSAPNYDDFIKMVNRVLDRYVSQKKRYIESNKIPFITPELNKLLWISHDSEIGIENYVLKNSIC